MTETKGADNLLCTPEVICPRCRTAIKARKRATRVLQDISVGAAGANAPIGNIPGIVGALGVAAVFNAIGTVKSSLFLNMMKCPNCGHSFDCKDFY